MGTKLLNNVKDFEVGGVVNVSITLLSFLAAAAAVVIVVARRNRIGPRNRVLGCVKPRHCFFFAPSRERFFHVSYSSSL